MRAVAAEYLPSACSCASLSAVTGHTAVRSAQKAAGTATRRAVCPGLPAAATCQQQRRSRGAHRAAQVIAAAAGKAMEVEVKLRLPGADAHKKLGDLLSAGRVATHQQENYFFDGPNRELNSKRVVLRLRFYDTDKKAEITVKGEQILVDGIGRASEVNEPVDAVSARQYLDNPSRMLQLPSELLQNLAKQYNLSSLICLGGFNNKRQEIQWRGVTLELDETTYPWGTLYELEVETDQPEELRHQLEEFLKQNEIEYSYSATSKFANFINKTLV